MMTLKNALIDVKHDCVAKTALDVCKNHFYAPPLAV